MTLQEALDEINNIAQQLTNSFTSVRADKIGLDLRCGNLLVSTEEGAIAVKTSRCSTLEYYGGFEYVDAEDKCVLGEYTLYLSTSNRVDRALSHLVEVEEDEMAES